MKQLQYKKQIDADKKHVDVSVSVTSFIDDNTHIIYCPALDLSGYGIDETDAPSIPGAPSFFLAKR